MGKVIGFHVIGCMYLFSGDDMIRSIDYARDNLRRARLPEQRHSFITPYGGTNEDAR